MTWTPRAHWYLAATLLGLAGLFLAAASAVRWFPCLGHLAARGCVARQNRTNDYLVPTRPWQALPASAVLAGLGLLLLAACCLLIVRRLHIRPALRVAMAGVLTVKPLLLGGMLLAAPALGVLPREARPVLLGAEIGLDVAALVLVLITPSDRLADYQRLLLAAVGFWLVGWVGQLLDALIFGLLIPVADTAPGSGLLTAEVVVGCGVGIALITRHDGERRSPTLAARDPLERSGHR
jgi:hypothetical protein